MSIKYPKAIYDQDEQRWISDAQVAETTYTAFTSRARRHQVTARLIVRRVKRLNPKTARRVRASCSPCTATVKSAWGAVPGLLRVRFPRPLAEPGVRLSSHRALHGDCRQGVCSAQGDGIWGRHR